ncbi:unnamed protein product [Lampetra planeri]
MRPPTKQGIKVQIHSQDEPPFIDQLGFGVAPGFQTFVSCQQQLVDIGGQMGLFIGASVLTILEIFDYLYELLPAKAVLTVLVLHLQLDI